MNNDFLEILNLVIRDSLPESKREPSYCSRLVSVGRLALNGIENEGLVVDEDYRRIVSVLLKGIRCMRETRHQVRLLSEFYGE